MKKQFKVLLSLLAPAAGILLALAMPSCTSSTALVASKANGTVIATVDQAMTAWAAYTQTHAVPASSILAVSNDYVAYYNAELVVSNLTVSYVASPSTNLSTALSAAINGVGANQTNLINIITQLTK